MAIANLDNLVAAFPGQRLNIIKPTVTTKGAGLPQSLWKVTNIPTAASSNPGSTAVIPTNSTAGGFAQTNPVSTLYLARVAVTSSIAGTLVIYDRLVHVSGLDGTQTVDTTITSGAANPVNRPDTHGNGTELWMEVYTALGATARTLTCKYTSSDGSSSAGAAGQSSTYAHPASGDSVAGQMNPMVLVAGDTGVKAFTSYSWSGTTSSAGDFGFTILRRIAEIPVITPNVMTVYDFADLGMPSISANACVAMMWIPTSTTTGNITGSVTFVDG